MKFETILHALQSHLWDSRRILHCTFTRTTCIYWEIFPLLFTNVSYLLYLHIIMKHQLKGKHLTSVREISWLRNELFNDKNFLLLWCKLASCEVSCAIREGHSVPTSRAFLGICFVEFIRPSGNWLATSWWKFTFHFSW